MTERRSKVYYLIHHYYFIHHGIFFANKYGIGFRGMVIYEAKVRPVVVGYFEVGIHTSSEYIKTVLLSLASQQ